MSVTRKRSGAPAPKDRCTGSGGGVGPGRVGSGAVAEAVSLSAESAAGAIAVGALGEAAVSAYGCYSAVEGGWSKANARKSTWWISHLEFLGKLHTFEETDLRVKPSYCTTTVESYYRVCGE